MNTELTQLIEFVRQKTGTTGMEQRDYRMAVLKLCDEVEAMATPRKYCLGGYELPLSVEFPNIGQNKYVRVIDARARLVRRFKSANEARAFTKHHNQDDHQTP